MRFGLFHNPHDLTRQRDYGDLLDELRDLATICDETDFDVFWMPEHHFSVWGRELLPNPLMAAVDVAARTRRIRIGLAAAIVTFWHPLRAAEDIALLDQLTGGRIEVGFGRGNYGLEASNLNPEANPNDQVKSKIVFDEAVSVIKAALTQERFSFKGEVYQFPAPGFRADRAHTVNDPAYVDPDTGELVKLSIYPRARQNPLPMWEVVNSLELDPPRRRPGPGHHHVAPAGGGTAGAAARLSRHAARGDRQGPAAWCSHRDHARYLRRR